MEEYVKAFNDQVSKSTTDKNIIIRSPIMKKFATIVYTQEVNWGELSICKEFWDFYY